MRRRRSMASTRALGPSRGRPSTAACTFWSSSAACNGDEARGYVRANGELHVRPRYQRPHDDRGRGRARDVERLALEHRDRGRERVASTRCRIQWIYRRAALSPGLRRRSGGSMSSLTTGSQSLISGYSAQPLANGTNTELAANWKAIIYLTCQILTGGTDPLLREADAAAPASHHDVSCSGGKS